MGLIRKLCVLFLAASSFLSLAAARVVRVEVTSRSDLNDGKPFGLAGPYEKIQGRVYFKVSAQNVHNHQIVDLDKAPQDPQGKVEFSADLYLIKPKDMAKGNGAVLFEVSNRGGRGILRIVNGGNAQSEFGDGFLMRQGYTLAWLGWQFDVGPQNQNLALQAPVARDAAGIIGGLVRSDFTPSEKRYDMPLGHTLLGPDGGKSYAVDDPANPKNVLTVRDTPEGTRQVIPRSEWSFARQVQGQLTPDAHFIHLNSGFVPGKIYEVVYTASNPAVVGVGLAAVRDFLSFLKYDSQAIAPVHHVYAVGISQSGRFLRHFLYQDFNADEEGRQVMDGVIAHVAGAGRGSFNHRFAKPSRDSQPMSSIFFPTDLFPFTDLPETDPENGETSGLLDAAAKSRTIPKIFYTNTSYEYWGRSAALIHTSPDGTKDAAVAENTRIYFFAGLQHFSDPFPPQRTTPGNPDYTAQQRHNPNPIRWFWRALITDMNDWVSDGAQPPASVYPRISDKTLVTLAVWQFPKIPGVSTPRDAGLAYRLDFGPQWRQGVISNEPPKVGKPYPGLVPQTDSDGNDMGGVRLPELQVPVATYTGWNLRDPAIGAPDRRLSFLGSYIPFARTAQERQSSGDPRPSVAERYASRDQYMGQYAAAALKLIQQRFMLAEDLPEVLARGQQEWEEVMAH
jgi:hypothetical protein